VAQTGLGIDVPGVDPGADVGVQSACRAVGAAFFTAGVLWVEPLSGYCGINASGQQLVDPD
jgi:hypothetical protein